MDKKTAILFTNLCWIIACLVASLTISVSIGWAQIPQLVNIISVALSLASLLLAVIAIIQALMSNESLSRSLSDINRAAGNIVETSSNLVDATSGFSLKFDQIGGMPNTLDSLNAKIDEMSLKAVNESVSVAIDVPKALPFSHSPELFLVDDVAKRSTQGTNVALYIAMKAYLSKAPFLCQDVIPGNYGLYADGVMSTLLAFKVMKLSKFDGKFMVEDLAPLSESIIRELLQKSIVKNMEKNADFLVNMKAKIDQYFLNIENTES